MNTHTNIAYRILLTVVVFIQFGCVMPYKSVESGPTAKLRVMMTKDDYVQRVYFYPDGTCDSKLSMGVLASEYYGPEGKGEGSQLNMPDGKSERDPTRKERVIQAEKPFTIELAARKPAYPGWLDCNTAFSFTPKTNSEYEVLHDIRDQICFLRVSELTLDGETVKRTPIEIIKRPFLGCWKN